MIHLGKCLDSVLLLLPGTEEVIEKVESIEDGKMEFEMEEEV